MKKFNLQEAFLPVEIATSAVITRNGHKVRITGYNQCASREMRVSGVVEINGDWKSHNWDVEGNYDFSKPHPMDLFMVDENDDTVTFTADEINFILELILRASDGILLNKSIKAQLALAMITIKISEGKQNVNSH